MALPLSLARLSARVRSPAPEPCHAIITTNIPMELWSRYDQLEDRWINQASVVRSCLEYRKSPDRCSHGESAKSPAWSDVVGREPPADDTGANEALLGHDCLRNLHKDRSKKSTPAAISLLDTGGVVIARTCPADQDEYVTLRCMGGATSTCHSGHARAQLWDVRGVCMFLLRRSPRPLYLASSCASPFTKYL